MVEPKRKVVIAGNWKMNKTIEEAKTLIKEFSIMIKDAPNPVYLAVPFTAIYALSLQSPSPQIVIGAQNMSDAPEGALTGEISGRMLVEAGARFVLLGHSERRHLFGESSQLVNRKVKRALQEGVEPLLCIGETIEQRNANQTEKVLREHLTQSLEGITSDQLQKIIIAYEPVWAIGTGKNATPEQAQEMLAFCRKLISEKWGAQTAAKITLLYGGSVTPENACTLMEQTDIDGLLIGGASLKADSFARIVNDQKLCTTKRKP